jgi:pimeloyl-ACP methyl ester carboxylesterase
MRRLFAVALFVTLTLAPSAAAKLPLHPCTLGGTEGLCGRLVVPEDRSRPEGRTISLRVMVLRATGKARPDPLFYIVGGPGSGSTTMASAFRYTFSELNWDRDIVLVDQRGTGGSNLLRCTKPPVGIRTQQQADAYVRGCVARLKGDARRYGTADAMDDLDAVRRALGYGKIDVYGVSYGATAAQVFLNRHPRSVRAVVLDGGTLLTIPIFERLGSNGQRALDLLARRCAADAACFRAFPHWESDLRTLIARLQRKPASPRVAGRRVALDGAGVAAVIQTLTLNAEDAAQIPFVATRALHGDLQPLARFAVRGSPVATPPTAVMPYSVMCTEPWATRRHAAVVADARGTYLSGVVRTWARNQFAVCHAFPKRVERASDWRAPRGQTPVLALVGGADPQDPIDNIAALRKTMPNTAFAVVPGEGHSVGQYGCMPSLVARFLDRGSVHGLDLSCVRRVSLPAFRLR